MTMNSIPRVTGRENIREGPDLTGAPVSSIVVAVVIAFVSGILVSCAAKTDRAVTLTTAGFRAQIGPLLPALTAR
jgi:hypothetical protein